MSYSYDYPHPAVTTDIVIFTIHDQRLELLLIKRRSEPFRGQWALPGGFVQIDEDLDTCAQRELAEETGLTGIYLEQLYTFGQPDRDPRERVISVAYYALVSPDRTEGIEANSDAKDVAWFELDKLPVMAFDHREIVNMAQQRLSAKLNYSTIALQFMPEQFTLGELQQVYECILGEQLDKRNFRKRVMALDCIKETGEYRRNGNHRPARLYAVKSPGQVEFIR